MAIEIEVEELLKEAREIMRALELPIAGGSPEEIARSLMLTGLGLLRAHKRQGDDSKAAAFIGRRIQQGPRPDREEAGLN